MNITEMLSSKTFIGVVEDNYDEKQAGRIKVRVTLIYDNIPLEDIPYASPIICADGKSYSVPDIGKIVQVQFINGDYYAPQYIASQHYNINLQEYLSSLSKEDYTSLNAINYDMNLQIYSVKSKGLMIDYNKTNINLTPEGDINMNLRDNKSLINLGSEDANQPIILSKHFFEWFDLLMDTLIGTPYIGNLGSPVVVSPTTIQIHAQYKALKDTFLSKHVYAVDNNHVSAQNRKSNKQIGDKYTLIAKSKDIKFQTQIKNKIEKQEEEKEQEIYETQPRDEEEVSSTKTADIDENKANILQRNIDVPKTFIAKSKPSNLSSLQITDLFLSDEKYNATEYSKNSIWLHHTAGSGSPIYTISAWESTTSKVATAFVIGGHGKQNGAIYRAFDEKYYAYHLGITTSRLRKIFNPVAPKKIHQHSIGIELCNWGYLTEYNGIYTNYVGGKIKESEVYYLNNAYRGYNYFHKYTDKQIDSLRKLLLELASKYGINIKKQWDANSFELDDKAISNPSGLFVHGNVRSDKLDIYPYPPMIDMLNSL